LVVLLTPGVKSKPAAEAAAESAWAQAAAARAIVGTSTAHWQSRDRGRHSMTQSTMPYLFEGFGAYEQHRL
jgi:hypothetical protein